jgi:hypothetical protein
MLPMAWAQVSNSGLVFLQMRDADSNKKRHKGQVGNDDDADPMAGFRKKFKKKY